MTRAAKILGRNPRLKKQMEEAKGVKPAKQKPKRKQAEPETLSFVIPLRAIPLERHRHSGGGSYLPTRSRKFREAVQVYMRQAMNGRLPMSGPLHAQFGFEFARPKTGPNAKAVFHSSKPDFDNLIKAICDAGNGILWHDDCQISSAEIDKRWGDEDGIYIVIEEEARNESD